MWSVSFGDGLHATVEVIRGEGPSVIHSSSAKAKRMVLEVLGKDAIAPITADDEVDGDGLIEENWRTFNVGARAHVYAALLSLPDSDVGGEASDQPTIIGSRIIGSWPVGG